MNIREIILDCKEILDEIDNGVKNFTLDNLSKTLEIEISFLMEMLENENIVIESNSISCDLLKQIILKEPETSPSPKNLRELILSSENLMNILNKEDGKDYVRISRLCKNFQMGVKNLIKIFNTEGLEIELNPNGRVKKEILLNLIAPKIDYSEKNKNKILEELEEKIKNIEENVYTKSVVLNQFIRSEQIREFAKIRANGICELCESNAPFKDKYGKPYLESHHIVYLSKGGKDSIENVAALCPNCHRKIHNLNLVSDIQKLLEKRN